MVMEESESSANIEMDCDKKAAFQLLTPLSNTTANSNSINNINNNNNNEEHNSGTSVLNNNESLADHNDISSKIIDSDKSICSDNTNTNTNTNTSNNNNNNTDSGNINNNGNRNNKNLDRCARCQEVIKDRFIFSVVNLKYHQDCLKCADCSIKMNDRCFTKQDGKFYCKRDFWRRFGPKCTACCGVIDQGDWVQEIKSMKKTYHLRCFNCQECKRQLKEGDHYHIIENRKLLCRQDFNHYSGQHQRVSNIKTSQNNNGIGLNDVDEHSPNLTMLSDSNGASKTNENQSNRNGSSQQQIKSLSTSIKSAPSSSNTTECTNYFIENHQGQRVNVLNRDREGIIDEGCFEEELDDTVEDFEEEQEVELDQADFESTEDIEFGIMRDNDGRRFHNHNHNNHHHHLSGRQMDSENEENRNNSNSKRRLQNSLGSRQANQVGLVQGNKRRIRRSQCDTTSKLVSLDGPTKLSQNCEGESILNGLNESQQTNAGSLLAMQPGIGNQIDRHNSSSQGSGGGSHLNTVYEHRQQHQQQQQHQQIYQVGTATKSRSSSSIASTGSNSSAASSSRGAHQQQSGPQQQSSSQQSSNSNGGHIRHKSQSQNGSLGHKPTRNRTVLNERQLETLRLCYEKNPRPDALVKEQLVDVTGLNPRVIRVWFQNKRCKDKKKNILSKQSDEEKDGHRACLMGGVQMVAESPIQFDDHSTLISPQQTQSQNRTPSSSKPFEINAYQAPWSTLADYAHQHYAVNSSGDPANGSAFPVAGEQLESSPPNAESPRFQQIIGQIHGYNPQQASESTGAIVGNTAAQTVPSSITQQQQQQHQTTTTPQDPHSFISMTQGRVGNHHTTLATGHDHHAHLAMSVHQQQQTHHLQHRQQS